MMAASRQPVIAWTRDKGESRTDTAPLGEGTKCPAEVHSAKRRFAGQGPMRSRRRRGVAALWLILALPVLVILLGVVIEIGNIWLARVELENALESAALAAVKEWGSAGGGDTAVSRLVGVEYAKANRVTGTMVGIADNYDAVAPIRPNQNEFCTGPTANLIFGAVTTTTQPWVFDAGVEPSCGAGEVLFDASAGPSMNQPNAWGINFHPATPATPAGLTIARVVYNLRSVDPNAYFDILTDAPVISSATEGGTPDSIYEPPNGQDDTFGVSTAALVHSVSGTVHTWTNGAVTFTLDTNTPWLLQIDFVSGTGVGFEPGDRIRFGAKTAQLGDSGTLDDGDAVGAQQVEVTVTFAIFGTSIVPNAVGEFFDSNFRKCSVGGRDLPPPDIDPCIPGNAPFVLPQAPASGNKNDDQSYVIVGATAGNALGVRAQGTANVNSVCCRLFDATLPVFKVSACATARYDCAVRRPELIRVTPENFICPAP